MDMTRSLAGFFRESARRTPDHPALIWQEGQLTYGELEELIRRIATTLGPLEGRMVGILAHRSPTAYAAVQAVLRQGGTYVPLNPAFPAVRNAFIVTRTGMETLVVGKECLDALEELLPLVDSGLRLVADEPSLRLQRLAVRHHPDTKVEIALCAGYDTLWPAGRLAYVLFTSGSTGEPKGVMVRQENVEAYVHNFLALYPILPQDRLTQTFDLSFDLSMHDQFVCWAAGATLVVFPDKALLSPLEWTARHGVTVWFSVPSVVAFLEGARQVVPDALPAVRLSLFCGEKLTWATSRIWSLVAPRSRQVNLYGPTEATIAITHFEIPHDFPAEQAHLGGIPIGTPYPGQSVQVRRKDGSACACGEIGGLWLGGSQVTDGYLGDETKTAERFVPDAEGAVWYRTGDLVLPEPDGTLQYVGREDFQVKVMGYRIELGEIEHALLEATGAAWALADVACLRGGQEEIFAVLPSHLREGKKSVKTSLRRRLPAYMVPRRFVYLDDVPLNANGKMDRGALRRKLEAAA